jgi:hypothetical protein
VISKKGKGWMRKCSGSLPNGKEIEEEAVVTISDNGSTHTWTGQVTGGDTNAEPFKNVWKRVSKE